MNRYWGNQPCALTHPALSWNQHGLLPFLTRIFHNLNNLLPQFWSVLHIFSVGADIVGINCHFDPETCVKTVKLMKEGVEKAGLKAHYMSQPLAFHTPDCGCQGFIDLPEFPFGHYPTLKKKIKKLKFSIHIKKIFFKKSSKINSSSNRSGAKDPDQNGHA